MFEIPKWGDDVPKSKVDFGKSQKVAKKKDTVSGTLQKPSKQQKSPSVLAKTIKKNSKKLKKNNQINDSNRQTKEKGFGKGNFSSKNKFKDNNKKPLGKPVQNSNPSKHVAEKNNNAAGNIASNKKKRPKKRKLNDPSTDSKKLTENNASSKPKKQKLSDEIVPEGSILFENSLKKKKTKQGQFPKSDINKSYGSKEDQKKEKLRQMLELETNRSKINVSGNNLRQRMLDRLKSAQFRFLNEKLYTTSGSEAQQLFQSDPDAFKTYHQGYQQQVRKWPVNPLDLIVKRISKMPKTHVVADMGCGEAALSRRVQQTVRSFDLVASAPGVEPCDMAHTPLLAASADVTVYCLALMGTDLTQYLLEANRVLKTGGYLLIAEVESRFDKVDTFVEAVERLGFKLKNLDESHKVFFFMEFVKVRDPPVKKGKLPSITLKPCLYKRR